MEFIDRILSLPEFAAQPPVLVEIAASGGTHSAWQALARYSICIAFDPDSRDMQAVHDETPGYRRLHVFPAAAVADDIDRGRIPPDAIALLLEPAATRCGGAGRLGLCPACSTSSERSASPACACQRRCESRRLARRLVQERFPGDRPAAVSKPGRGDLPERLAVEFEPGIIDAYEGEDKLSTVLAGDGSARVLAVRPATFVVR